MVVVTTCFSFEPPRVMREVGKNLGIPLFVFGPETHMTAIVGMALGKRAIEQEEKRGSETTANFLLPTSVSTRVGNLVEIWPFG